MNADWIPHNAEQVHIPRRATFQYMSIFMILDNRPTTGFGRINKERIDQAQARRRSIVETMVHYELSCGWKTRLAEAIGVHRGIITRDIKQIVRDYHQTQFQGLGERTDEKVELLEKFSSIVEQQAIRAHELEEQRAWETKKLLEKILIPQPQASYTPSVGSKPLEQPLRQTRTSAPHPTPYTISRNRSRFRHMRCFAR